MEVPADGSEAGPRDCQGFNDHTFGDQENLSVFVDDFHESSDTFEEQVVSMKRLLQRGREHGVQWRLTKCSFCYPSVTLIGFRVSAHGRQPDPSKNKALKEWPEEQSIEDLVSMFHFAIYLREFIPDFHRIAAPLKPYRAKGAKWETYLQDKVAQKLPRSCACRWPTGRRWSTRTSKQRPTTSQRASRQAVSALRGRQRLRVQWRAGPGTGHPRHSGAHRSAPKVLR